MLVGKASEQGGASPVLVEACSAKSQVDARTKMRQIAQQSQVQAMVPKTLLMTLFSERNYYGEAVEVHGEYGPCDPEGYRIQLDGNTNSRLMGWDDKVTSVDGTRACDKAAFVPKGDGFTAYLPLPTPDIGPGVDNNVERIWVYNIYG